MRSIIFFVGLRGESGFPVAIALSTDSLEIQEGSNYQLRERISGNVFAIVLFRRDHTIPGFIDNTANSINTGVLRITNLN